MIGRWSWTLAVAGGLLVGCSSTEMDSSPASQDGGPDVANTTPPPPEGGGSDVQQTTPQVVGSSGGAVSGQGVVLTIPQGALATDTQITITKSAAPIPSGYTGLSALYTFGPSGTVFLKPVTVDFPLAIPYTNGTVYWSNATGGYDPLVTSLSATNASASVTHFSEGFVAANEESADAAADVSPEDDSSAGTDSGEPDTAAAEDAAVADVTTASDGTAPVDAGSVPDAGVIAESGATDGGAVADSSGPDASAADSGATDAASSDAGVPGITATIDGVVTTFATNVTFTNPNSISIIGADDNATSTHWRLELMVGTVPQEVCSTSLSYPVITYTHFTSGVADSVFSTKQVMGYCNVVVTSTPGQFGQHARGVFSGGVDRAQDAGNGAFLHLISSGSYDAIMLPAT